MMQGKKYTEFLKSNNVLLAFNREMRELALCAAMHANRFTRLRLQCCSGTQTGEAQTESARKQALTWQARLECMCIL